MALRINAQIETDTGFTTNRSLVFLDIFLPKGGQWVNLTYFESRSAFRNGKNSITPVNLPEQITLNIPTNVFWRNNLANAIHLACKAEIEKITGKDTVEIIQDPYSAV